MKTKSAFISICAGSFLTVFTITAALADTQPIMQDANPNPNHVGEGLLFGLAFLVLLGLAFWLLKSSNVLDDNLNENELNGKRWLNDHLNNLETNQLDELIKWGEVREKDEENAQIKNKL